MLRQTLSAFSRGLLASPLGAYAPATAKAVLLALSRPPHLPRVLQIEPSRLCNLKCVICYRTYWDQKIRPPLDFDVFRGLLAQLPDLKEVILNGIGEPFLNPRMMDMVEYAHTRGMFVRFNTNFSLVDVPMLERLARMANVEIVVSIDTNDPDVFADIRRGTRLEAVLGNLQTFLEARRRVNGPSAKVAVNCVLMKCVLPSLFDLIRLLKDMGVDRFHLSDLSVPPIDPAIRLLDGSTMKEQRLSTFMSEQEVAGIVAQVREFESDVFPIDVLVSPPRTKGVKKRENLILTCIELWTSPYITCDGYVTPCCCEGDPAVFNMGNVQEHAFGDIWYGAPYRALRLQHLTNRPPTRCLGCNSRICPVGSLYDSNRTEGKPHCAVEFLNLRARMRVPRKRTARLPSASA